ncbi:hypothetical protein MPH_08684 [Macrophomina phaseolina MS6]|uniref:Uncharacterized protein n=1 Tax=Macrophomina phaseolina (strain MS6) TaxID=1126212 RepID=K2RHR1_MACPH|nr:hypothetical protein MPH_08684 [Macrophomina phaseolina MS6]
MERKLMAANAAKDDMNLAQEAGKFRWKSTVVSAALNPSLNKFWMDALQKAGTEREILDALVADVDQPVNTDNVQDINATLRYVWYKAHPMWATKDLWTVRMDHFIPHLLVRAAIALNDLYEAPSPSSASPPKAFDSDRTYAILQSLLTEEHSNDQKPITFFTNKTVLPGGLPQMCRYNFEDGRITTRALLGYLDPLVTSDIAANHTTVAEAFWPTSMPTTPASSRPSHQVAMFAPRGFPCVQAGPPRSGGQISARTEIRGGIQAYGGNESPGDSRSSNRTQSHHGGAHAHASPKTHNSPLNFVRSSSSLADPFVSGSSQQHSVSLIPLRRAGANAVSPVSGSASNGNSYMTVEERAAQILPLIKDTVVQNVVREMLHKLQNREEV